MFTYARPRDLIGQLRLPCVAIEFFDGERITLDHGLEKLPSLAAFVRKATFDHLLGRADTDASLGPIHFGPLVLSLRGLSLGACIWEWSEIKYAIDGGSLVIVPATGPFGSDEHFRIPLVDIPNVGVLIRLMAKRGKPPVHIRETQPTRLAIH